ncbi:MAG: DUF4249 family protein [Bacteroidota bacterium]
MRSALLLLALGFTAGCDLAEEDFRPDVVVEGVLIAEEPMTSVRLSESAPIGEVYAFERQALSGATVRVVLLSASGESEQTVRFVEDVGGTGTNGGPGVYVPELRPKPVVQAGRRYRLEVEVPGERGLVPPGTLVRAETTVPDTFRIEAQPPPAISYDIDAPSPALDVTSSDAPGRQAIFVFNIRALEPERYPLTPLAAAFVEDGDLDAENLTSTSSPILNEANYARNADGTLRLRVPWFAINYFGPNVFTVNALDDALYDFLRSRNAQFNPTTLSPGEIQRVLSNVEHGLGLFGSLARARADAVDVLPPR